MKTLACLLPLSLLAACQSTQQSAPRWDGPLPSAPASPRALSGTFEVDATPTLWAVSVDGDLTVGALPEAQLDLALSEADPALGVALDIDHRDGEDSHTLMFEVLYGEYEDNSRILDTEFDHTMVELALALPCGEESGVEYFLGARYWSTNGEVSAPVVPVSSDRSESWTDPILGARTTIAVSDGTTLMLRGDYGGFGVGADSTWQAQVALQFGLGEGSHMNLGWRHLVVDYDSSSYEFDATLTGPTLGLTTRF